ncbi:MAG: hypothetical protein PHF25_07090 [Candidatus Margulisbacteria bacterium]|nr:hypothetical protein [Candidatus Margulisiibacteriota bacterium]
MKNKIIALRYEIPEIKDYKGNVFLELSLVTLQEEVNNLLIKHPEKREQILIEAEVTKTEIVQIYEKIQFKLRSTAGPIKSLEISIKENESKLQRYQADLENTTTQLQDKEKQLISSSSITSNIKQIKKAIQTLVNLRNLLINYPSTILLHLKQSNEFNKTIEMAFEKAKNFYRKKPSEKLELSSPILESFAREAIEALLDSQSSTQETLSLDSLLSSEKDDFIIMIILYLERLSFVEISNEDLTKTLMEVGFTKKETEENLTEIFKKDTIHNCKTHALMKPFAEWEESTQMLSTIIYNQCITKDLVKNEINLIIEKAQLTKPDIEKLITILNDSFQLELPLILRLKIYSTIAALVNKLKKELKEEIKQKNKLAEVNAMFASKKIIDPEIEEKLAIANKAEPYTTDIIKNFYKILIPVLEQYGKIVLKQATERYNQALPQSLIKIKELIDVYNNKLDETNKTQQDIKEVEKALQELKSQFFSLNTLVKSMQTTINQEKTNLERIDKELMRINSSLFDSQLDQAERLIKRLSLKINHPSEIEEESIEELDLHSQRENGYLNIGGVDDWEKIEEGTAYFASNKQGIKINFMFAKKILKDVHENLTEKFLKAMKNGLVGPKDTDGMKYMKEKKGEGKEYEIKVMKADRRIYGHLEKIENQEVVVFDSYGTH